MLPYKLVRFASTSASKEFLPLEIKGLTVLSHSRSPSLHNVVLRLPRHWRYPTEIDWTNIWPAPATFHHTVVPIPLRQGYCKNQAENSGISPEAYANAELMKIPNFLHLTEKHIAKHCDALKKFCTKWPEGLNSDDVMTKHYPMEIIHSNYIFSAPSIRDPRSRLAKIRVCLSHFNLDDRAKRKLLRLAIGPGPGKRYCRYDWKTDMLELTTDRCPSVRQNIDFLRYALSVLVLESKATKSWEQTSLDYDCLAFDWNTSESRKRLMTLLQSKQLAQSESNAQTENIDSHPLASEYRDALEKIWSENDILRGDQWIERPKQPRYKHQPYPDITDVPFEPIPGADNDEFLTRYGQATRKLFGLGSASKTGSVM